MFSNFAIHRGGHLIHSHYIPVFSRWNLIEIPFPYYFPMISLVCPCCFSSISSWFPLLMPTKSPFSSENQPNPHRNYSRRDSKTRPALSSDERKEHIWQTSGWLNGNIWEYMGYIYIYIYIRATPGFCPGVAASIYNFNEKKVLQITAIPMGKITQVLETIKQTRSKHPKFLWEKQKRHNTCNSYGKNNNGRTACSRAADLVFHLCWVRSLASWTRSQRPPAKRLFQDADLKSRACGVCISLVTLVLSAQSSGLVSREGVSRPASQCDCWLDCSFLDD